MLEHLAGVVGHQVAVAADHGGRPAQRTARLLVQEPNQEQPIARKPSAVTSSASLECCANRSFGWGGWII
jgi:hypothetical protein